MTKRSYMSPAMYLAHHVCEHEGHQMGRSRDRMRHAKQAAIRMAIRYGLRFDLDDFVELSKPISSYDGTYWLHYVPDEVDYALACGGDRGVNNPSAVKAIEKAWGRKPFIIREPGEKTGKRIYVGRRFAWHIGTVTCTSFAKDQSYLVACTYKNAGRDSPDGVAVGAFIGTGEWGRGPYRRVENVSPSGLKVTLSKQTYGHDEVYGRDIERRVKIDHQAIRDFHAAYTQWKDVVEPLACHLPDRKRAWFTKGLIKRYGFKHDSIPTLDQLKDIEAELSSLTAATWGARA